MLTQKTVLFNFLLDKFGFKKFDELRNKFKDYEWECAGNSFLFQLLVRESGKIAHTKLREYEDSIIVHLSL